jgi:ATP-dependent DNA ligase
MAILATSPSAARDLQQRQNAWLRLHAFDVLRFRGDEVVALPLVDRMDILTRALAASQNPYLGSVPSFAVGKAEVHRRVLQAGGEGTVWKRLGGRYEPGRRARHWLKRKAEVQLEAFVTGFRPGDPDNGHAHLVGAVEFSVNGPDGSVHAVAWVSGWSDAERHAMTWRDRDGGVRLNQAFLGRRAVIAGHDRAAKSQRLRHARFLGWVGA